MFNESIGLYGRMQQEGRIEQFDVVLLDVALALADGGDCLSDLCVLRDQPALFGPVASTPTASASWA